MNLCETAMHLCETEMNCKTVYIFLVSLQQLCNNFTLAICTISLVHIEQMEAEQFRTLHPYAFFHKFLAHAMRPDGRTLLKTRNTLISASMLRSTNGSAMVRLGNTSVLCGIRALVTEPREHEPHAGFCFPAVHLSNLTSYAEGARRAAAREELGALIAAQMGSVLQGCIDLSRLSIHEGKAVWVLFVDIYVLEHDGNIFDACLLAALTALHSLSLPRVTYDEEQSTVYYIPKQEDKQDSNNNKELQGNKKKKELQDKNKKKQKDNDKQQEEQHKYMSLKEEQWKKDHSSSSSTMYDCCSVSVLQYYPIPLSFGVFVEESGEEHLIVDPTAEEESLLNMRVTVILNSKTLDLVRLSVVPSSFPLLEQDQGGSSSGFESHVHSTLKHHVVDQNIKECLKLAKIRVPLLVDMIHKATSATSHQVN